MDLSMATNQELISELKSREGTTELISAPYLEYEVKTATQKVKQQGPATILIIEDYGG